MYLSKAFGRFSLLNNIFSKARVSFYFFDRSFFFFFCRFFFSHFKKSLFTAMFLYTKSPLFSSYLQFFRIFEPQSFANFIQSQTNFSLFNNFRNFYNFKHLFLYGAFHSLSFFLLEPLLHPNSLFNSMNLTFGLHRQQSTSFFFSYPVILDFFFKFYSYFYIYLLSFVRASILFRKRLFSSVDFLGRRKFKRIGMTARLFLRKWFQIRFFYSACFASLKFNENQFYRLVNKKKYNKTKIIPNVYFSFFSFSTKPQKPYSTFLRGQKTLHTPETKIYLRLRKSQIFQKQRQLLPTFNWKKYYWKKLFKSKIIYSEST